MTPDRLDQLTEQTRRRTPIIGGYLRRRAAWRLWTRRTPDAVRRLAIIAGQTEDPSLRHFIFDRFDLLSAGRAIDWGAIDAIISGWVKTRSPALAAFIQRKGWMAREPLEIRVISALLVGQEGELGDLPAVAVETLLSLAAESGDSGISVPVAAPEPLAPLVAPSTPLATQEALARSVTRRLAESAKAVLAHLTRPDAREAVCNAYLDDDSLIARDAALAGGYEPDNPARRAIYYFLTGSWAAYESLDFDGGFLRSAYELAGPKLRNRLAAAARAAGRMEHVAAAAREGRRVGEMTDVEWESALAVLAGGNRWDDLWRLAQAAPPRWAARMILRLAAQRWKPTGVSGSFQTAFIDAARSWHDPVDGFLPPPDTLEGHTAGITAIVASPDGSIVVSTGKDRQLRIWTIADRKSMVRQIGEVATHLFIAPDGRSLAVAGVDGFVTLWGLPEGRPIARMPAHVGPVYGLAAVGEGANARLVTVGEDARVRLWALPSGLELQTLGVGQSPITSLATFGEWIVAGDDAGKMMFWNAGTYGDPSVSAYQPDLDALSEAAPEFALSVTRPGRPKMNFRPIAPAPIWSVGVRGDKIRSVAVADGGKSAAAFAGGDVTLVRLPLGRPMHLASARVGDVTVATAVPNARFVCVAGTDGRISLVRAADGTVLRTLDGHRAPVRAVAASADGHLLATGGGEGSIHLWGLPDGKRFATVDDLGGPIRRLLFSPAGGTLLGVVGDSPSIRVWDVERLRLSRVPLAEMTLRDLQRLQTSIEQTTTENAPPAAFVAALLGRRFEHDVLIDEVKEGAMQVGEFDIELG